MSGREDTEKDSIEKEDSGMKTSEGRGKWGGPERIEMGRVIWAHHVTKPQQSGIEVMSPMPQKRW